MSKIANPTKVITGVNTRRSYANVWDPKSINGAAPKYSVSLIIPKSDTVTVNKIKAAIQAAYEEGESKLKGTAKVCPALDVIKTPLRDGDKERPGDEAYKDSYFINANSATAPGIVDGSSSSDESTYLGIFKLYSFFRISSLVTNFANFVTDFLAFNVSTISLISLALNLLFFPTFSNFLDASIMRISESDLVLLSTIIIVGIPVPKNIFAGKPIIASIAFRKP